MLSADTLACLGILDLIESPDPQQAEQIAIAELLAALAPAGSGINIIPGSARFVGRVGDGENPNLAQSATFTDLELNSSTGLGPTISLPGNGILLTSGTADVPSMNTSTSFGVSTALSPQTAEEIADKEVLESILASAGQSTDANDINLLEFSFTVDADVTSISANFVFGSDEFPDQTSFSDLFVFVVDGVNYAAFPDGTLVSFLDNSNEQNFNNNDLGTAPQYTIEYDGISNRLGIVGLLAEGSTDGLHTLTIAVADTRDTAFDSGVFLSSLSVGNEQQGGIIENPDIRDPSDPDTVASPPLLPALPGVTTPDIGGVPDATDESDPDIESIEPIEESEGSIGGIPFTPPPSPDQGALGGGSSDSRVAEESARAGLPAQQLIEPRIIDEAFAEGFEDIARVAIYDQQQTTRRDDELLLVVAETDVPDTFGYSQGEETPLRRPTIGAATQIVLDLPAPDKPLLASETEASATSGPQYFWWLAAIAVPPLSFWAVRRKSPTKNVMAR